MRGPLVPTKRQLNRPVVLLSELYEETIGFQLNHVCLFTLIGSENALVFYFFFHTARHSKICEISVGRFETNFIFFKLLDGVRPLINNRYDRNRWSLHCKDCKRAKRVPKIVRVPRYPTEYLNANRRFRSAVPRWENSPYFRKRRRQRRVRTHTVTIYCAIHNIHIDIICIV